MIKIDFTNVLEVEINNISEIISAIKNEISVRRYEAENPSTEFTGIAGYQPKPLLSPIDKAVNRRIIAELTASLKSKEDWLQKLKDKRVIDEAETDSEYQKSKDQEELTDLRFNGLNIADPHEAARFKYLKTEFDLWMDKKLDPAHKEACVFYYRSMKEVISANQD